MLAEFWFPILVKALATASLVVSASILAEKLGPFWGALIVSLPISVGAAYVFLAIQHDAGFVAASALGSCAANAGTGLFLIAYGLRAAKVPVWNGIGVAIVIWLAASLVIQAIDWTPVTASLANIVVYGASFTLLGREEETAAATRRSTKGRWFELPLRGAVVAGFVVTVVLASSALGPKATGIAAAFPISFISLLFILQRRLGGHVTALLARNAFRPMLGFGTMLLVLHFAVQSFGLVAGLSLGLLTSIGWSAGLLLHRAYAARRLRRSTHPS